MAKDDITYVVMECRTGGSNKYYGVFEKPGEETVSDYGRIRYTTLDASVRKAMLLSAEPAKAKKDALVREKLGRGYVIVEEGVMSREGISTKSVGGGTTDAVRRTFESLSAEPTDFSSPEADKGPRKPEEPFVEKEIVLAKCKEPKEYVPAGEWFLDTGYLKPIAAGIALNKAVLLKGDTGTGKTSAVRFLASVTKNGFRRLNLNGSTTVDEFVGRWKLNDKGGMVWVDGVLTEAMRKGLWLLTDEINACLPEIAFVLHSVLDDDRYLVLAGKDGEIVRPHPDFRFFASMNPDYAGTHALNLAFEDRFPIVVHFDYPDQAQEAEIVMRKSGNKRKDLVDRMLIVAKKAREEFRQEKLITPFSTRRLIDWATLSLHFTPAKAFALAVLNKMCKEDKVVVRDIAGVVFKDEEFRQVLELGRR